MTRSSAGHGPGIERAQRARLRPPTQVLAPYRDVARHVVSSAIALIPLLVLVVEELEINKVPWIASTIATAAIIARVMNTPAGEEWLARFMPWLAAESYSPGNDMR